MIWRIKIDGKDHFVRYKAGIESGEVLVDGNIVDSKSSSSMGVLVKKSFKIEGKPAKVQRHSLLSEDWELVCKGKACAPPERAITAIKTEEAGNGKNEIGAGTGV
jgi:hypothetical protein